MRTLAETLATSKENKIATSRGPRHVLFLIDRFPERIGGAEGILWRATRLLPKDRYRCSVATFAVDPRFGDVRSLFECPFHVFPLKRTYDWNAFRVAIRIANLIRRERVSIVHTFFSTSDLWGGTIAKLSGCPVLISSRRDMGIERSTKHRRAYRVLAGLFDQVQAVSDRVRSYSISADGLRPDRVVTVHNGVDLKEIDAAPPLSRSDEALGIHNASHIVLNVGNVRRVKGTDVMIRTVAIVREKFPNVLFLLVGGVHERVFFAEVQRLITDLRVTDNVQFLGQRLDVPSILKICDIFYQSSRSEGLPNAVLEAMASGLPCVATDVGGTNEIICNDENGFLVESERPDLAAKAIIHLLGDQNRARIVGAAARRTIEQRFSAQAMVNRMVDHYDSLLAVTTG
jgi:glycosyltransferase involved in cell wall biosynthesis